MEELIQAYDSFIIDLWGVIHDGSTLYPGAADALAAMHAAQKPVVLLSNAPRRAHKSQAVLDMLGVPRAHYQQLITSGEVAFRMLQAQHPYGRRYYYLGPGKDEDVLADLPAYTSVSRPEDADFILNTGYEQDYQPHDAILPLLTTLAHQALPLLCINPDMEVVKQDGSMLLCAGSVAAAYAAMGGSVHYIGKPYADVYHAARQALGPDKHPLCIGDNPHTDIKGANAAGLRSLLIIGGILHTSHHIREVDEALAACCAAGATPDYVRASFSL